MAHLGDSKEGMISDHFLSSMPRIYLKTSLVEETHSKASLMTMMTLDHLVALVDSDTDLNSNKKRRPKESNNREIHLVGSEMTMMTLEVLEASVTLEAVQILLIEIHSPKALEDSVDLETLETLVVSVVEVLSLNSQAFLLVVQALSQ